MFKELIIKSRAHRTCRPRYKIHSSQTFSNLSRILTEKDYSKLFQIVLSLFELKWTNTYVIIKFVDSANRY